MLQDLEHPFTQDDIPHILLTPGIFRERLTYLLCNVRRYVRDSAFVFIKKTFQSTVFQSCQDGATTSWVLTVLSGRKVPCSRTQHDGGSTRSIGCHALPMRFQTSSFNHSFSYISEGGGLRVNRRACISLFFCGCLGEG